MAHPAPPLCPDSGRRLIQPCRRSANTLTFNAPVVLARAVVNRPISLSASNFQSARVKGELWQPDCFSIGVWRSPGERKLRREFVNSTPTPGQETRCRRECNHETSIRSRLVPHSARAAPLEDFRVHSLCDLAGALIISLALCRGCGKGADS
jgi:hypothetical protein